MKSSNHIRKAYIDLAKLNLTQLNDLTHERMNAAIQSASKKNPLAFALENPEEKIFTEDSPHQRLAILLLPGQKNEMNQAGLAVLTELMSVDFSHIKMEDNHHVFFASNIFLKFMIQGDKGYQSEFGEENTCLHDALLSPLRNDLTRLLIQNGADPLRENGDHLSPLAVFITMFYRNISCNYKDYLISSLNFHEGNRIDRLFFAILIILQDATIDPCLFCKLQACMVYSGNILIFK